MKGIRKAAAVLMILAFAFAVMMPVSAKVDDSRTTVSRGARVISLGTGQPKVGLTVEDVSLNETITTKDASGDTSNKYTLTITEETWKDSSGKVMSPSDKFEQGKYIYHVSFKIKCFNTAGESVPMDPRQYMASAPYVKWVYDNHQSYADHIEFTGTAVILKDKDSVLDISGGSVKMDCDVHYNALIETLLGTDGVYNEYEYDSGKGIYYTKVDLNYNGSSPVFDMLLTYDENDETAQFEGLDSRDSKNIVKLVLSDAKKEEIYGRGDYCYDSLTVIFKRSLKDCKVAAVKDQVYTGKAIKPAVKVTFNGEAVTSGQYTLSYSANKNVGTAKIKITGKNGLNDSKTVSFRILPKGTKISKLVPAKKAFTAKWAARKTKMSKARVNGYQVQYALNKSFTKKAKAVKVKGYKTTSKKIGKLKKKTVYYVRVRTYMKVGKTTYYSKWSAPKKVKTK